MSAVLVSHFRSWELPWGLAADQDQRFKRLQRQLILASLAFALVMPFLPVPEQAIEQEPEVPPRFAKLIIEKKPPPPPEPVVVEPVVQPEPVPVVESQPEPKPEPVVEPVVAPQPTAREKASKAGVMAFADSLADLRRNSALSAVANSEPLENATAPGPKSERALLTSKATTGSKGIETSSMSRATGGGALAGRSTTQVDTPVLAAGNGSGEVQSNSGLASRSREEIELVFDQNKGAIYALYNRALRKDPGLSGKLVLKLTIEPSGAVSACEVVSSELGSPELERKLVQRVKMFRFAEKDVATVTTTKPIDFFPA